MRKLVFLIFVFAFNIAFSQKEAQVTTSKTSIMFSAGKFFSNYRYYKYYDGLESVNISISQKISNRWGLSINQNYGRMFNERINNEAKTFHTTLNIFVIPVKYKKLDLDLSVGGGLQQIHNKCLYNSYPFVEHIYGSSVNAKMTVIYHLNQKIAFNINYNMYRSYLFLAYDNYIPQDPYYYKTMFSSVNIGFYYSFRKKEKK